MSVETEKCTYLTVILPNCYSSESLEEVQHQALKSCRKKILMSFGGMTPCPLPVDPPLLTQK